MRHIIIVAGLAAVILTAGPAQSAEQAVTLAVDNLFCASCPYIVKRTLANLPGVSDVAVSFEKKTAVVIFDDARTDVAALIRAATEIGFPSRIGQSE